MSEHRGALGDYLRRALDKQGWTPADLARASGVSASNIGRYLAGTSTITVENARLVAEAVDRPVLEVLVAARILSAEEAQVDVIAADPLRALGHREILAELDRRLSHSSNDVLAELTAMAHDPELSEDVALPDRGPGRGRKGS